MKLLLVGNFGVGNFGDEAIKQYYLRHFPEHEWTVVTANPKEENEVPRLPFGVRSLVAPWWITFGALTKSDGVVFAGGSLFTDVESIFACFLWGMYALFARIFRKKTFFAFQGVGPFRSSFAAFLTRLAFKNASFISVRDHGSFERAQNLTSIQIVEAADPVALLFSEFPTPTTGSSVLFIPRGNSTEDFFMEARLLSQFENARIVSLQPDDPAEQDVITKLQLFSGRDTAVREVRTFDDMYAAFNGSKQVLSQRYHGTLAALIFGVPYKVIYQGKGDKLASLDQGHLREEVLKSAMEGEEALKEVLK